MFTFVSINNNMYICSFLFVSLFAGLFVVCLFSVCVCFWGFLN